jgi:hypothetical protein
MDREIVTGLNLLHPNLEAHAAALEFDSMRTRIAEYTIIRVYSGRPGCGCGCRGKYSTRTARIAQIRRELMARANEVREHDGILALEDDRRYFWAYSEA